MIAQVQLSRGLANNQSQPDSTMSLAGVTVYPANVPIQPWERWKDFPTSATDLLKKACQSEYNVCERVIQSSFDEIATAKTSPSHNGFVNATVIAYGQHHHLTIRPEDIWFSIIVQLSFYVNAHAKQLQSFFVSHEGKKHLRVGDTGNLETADLGRIAVTMTEAMQKYVVDSDLREWIMPNFTTTTTNDVIVAAVLMMGAVQEYFSYEVSIICGLPSVTLLGQKKDWVDLRQRLDKIGRLGDEPALFANLLKPVLDHFILSFEDPNDPMVLDFWSRIVHRAQHLCGQDFLSGWITAFCFWDSDGELLHMQHNSNNTSFDSHVENFNLSKGAADIDWTMFHTVSFFGIPDGFASVPVLIDNNGVKIKSRMVAGSVGIKVWSSGEPMEDYQRAFPDEPLYGDDSIQPVSGWWMYELIG